jgi:hypothetical protein
VLVGYRFGLGGVAHPAERNDVMRAQPVGSVSLTSRPSASS